MKTMLSTRSPVVFSAAMTCAVISPAVRLRFQPRNPLAQNLHP